MLKIAIILDSQNNFPNSLSSVSLLGPTTHSGGSERGEVRSGEESEGTVGEGRDTVDGEGRRLIDMSMQILEEESQKKEGEREVSQGKEAELVSFFLRSRG